MSRIHLMSRFVLTLLCICGVLCCGCKDKQSDKWLPKVEKIPVEQISLTAPVDSEWKRLTGKRLSIKTPCSLEDRFLQDREEIQQGYRSISFAGSALSSKGEPFLFHSAIDRIDDNSVPEDRLQNPLRVLEDLYSFDSSEDAQVGEYRYFLHNTAVFFRHRNVTRVMVVNDESLPFRRILYEGREGERVFVICEVYSLSGNALSRIKLGSKPGDLEWIFESLATIVLID
ncbi:MAG: hypothetical protein ACK5RF_18835 [Pirellula sp.]|jgi:hypothetical protein